MNRQLYIPVTLAVAFAIAFAGCRANQSQQPLFGGGPQGSGSLFGATGFGGANPGGIGNNGSLFGGNTGGGLGQLFTPNSGQVQAQQAMGQANQFASQVGGLNSRLNQFDSDNQNLHAQVAALQQRLQNANSYNDQLKTQLSDQMLQLQQAQLRAQQTQQMAANSGAGRGNGQYAGFQQPGQNNAYQNTNYQNRQVPGQFANTGGRGVGTTGNVSTGFNNGAGNGGTAGAAGRGFNGATIRANNGLMQKLNSVQLPGYKAWMDGDVIRIEGPTDRLFVSGTYQLNQNDASTVSNLANTIRQNFPRQVIGVEAHWDGTPIEPATTSHHQLTATQALAVFDLLVKSGLPHDQVFTMAMGSNRLRYPNGNPANRRIEIVIYPETF